MVQILQLIDFYENKIFLGLSIKIAEEMLFLRHGDYLFILVSKLI
jgi:hypothetical protein